MEFDDSDYEQDEDFESEPARRRKRARLSGNLFIDAEAGVDEDANCDKGPDDEIDDLDGFEVADDVE